MTAIYAVTGCKSAEHDEYARQPGSGGAPADIDTRYHKVTHLEQQIADLLLQFEERDDELSAARAANRELRPRAQHEWPIRARATCAPAG
jgi:hypothetical protein